MKLLKSCLCVLLLSLLAGLFLYQEEQFSLNQVDTFFAYTNRYSPVKLPRKITNQAENQKIMQLLEKAAQSR